MELIDQMTSTGAKYARSWDMISSLRAGVGHPRSLQVSPTNRCNLRCVFCSVDERDLHLEWEYEELREAIRLFYYVCGIKTVEFSGGGDPTVYPDLEKIASWCRSKGLRLGMITNGIKIHEFDKNFLSLFDWIRISMVTLDYYETIKIPEYWPEGTALGMSYVIGQINYTGGNRKHYEGDEKALLKVQAFAKRFGARYVRIVPECFTDEAEMKEKHKVWGAMTEKIGPPLFFQPKIQTQAHQCWMDAVKPWLHSDGHVYPCNALTLNTDAKRDFDPSYRLCHWTKIPEYYLQRGKESLNVKRCDRCSFVKNNEVIGNLLTPMEFEAFV